MRPGLLLDGSGEVARTSRLGRELAGWRVCCLDCAKEVKEYRAPLKGKLIHVYIYI